jgi:hypothetical protein
METVNISDAKAREYDGTSIERFDCADGDHWYSLVQNGDVVTGVMHKDRESASLELLQLLTE